MTSETLEFWMQLPLWQTLLYCGIVLVNCKYVGHTDVLFLLTTMDQALMIESV